MTNEMDKRIMSQIIILLKFIKFHLVVLKTNVGKIV